MSRTIDEAALVAASNSSMTVPLELSEAAVVALRLRDDPRTLAAALAVAIDSVRHLHMGAEPESRSRTLDEALSLLATPGAEACHPRLTSLLRAAVSQQERLLEEESR